jgi:hypothetical protein
MAYDGSGKVLDKQYNSACNKAVILEEGENGEQS